MAAHRFLDEQFNGFLGQSVAVNRDVQLRRQHAQTLDVILMFVRNEDAGEAFRRSADAQQAVANLAGAQAGVDEQARLVCFEVSAIATGTAAENCELHWHACEASGKTSAPKTKTVGKLDSAIAADVLMALFT